MVESQIILYYILIFYLNNNDSFEINRPFDNKKLNRIRVRKSRLYEFENKFRAMLSSRLPTLSFQSVERRGWGEGTK